MDNVIESRSPALKIQRVTPVTDARSIAKILESSDIAGTYQHNLSFIYSTVGSFSQSFSKEYSENVFLVYQDDYGDPLAWASACRYHERDGYRGVYRLDIDALLGECSKQAFQALYYQCEHECLKHSVHTFVTFVHQSMSDMAMRYQAIGFESNGGIVLSGGRNLYVYSRRISP